MVDTNGNEVWAEDLSRSEIDNVIEDILPLLRKDIERAKEMYRQKGDASSYHKSFVYLSSDLFTLKDFLDGDYDEDDHDEEREKAECLVAKYAELYGIKVERK